MSWHDPVCDPIEIHWKDQRVGCRRCGKWAPTYTEGVKPVPPPAPPPDTPRSQLRCTWPPSVEFSNDAFFDNFKDFIRENIDNWRIDNNWEDRRNAPAPAPDTCVEEHTSSNSCDAMSSPSNTTISTIYEPITKAKRTRLLRLYGSRSFHDPIHCSLEIVRLGQPSGRHLRVPVAPLPGYCLIRLS
ncbi:hypothetical protein EJ04DRAFT_87950 [Polyplosphaeria fusca]|uniref:Uncharacterized protein n=1 Tax=Polyplosphaeria fusca TaxID=682080 RepID=A0A9P4QQ06_9PLEO|nr:hypothetical protein EJ04DRAFT_87950 [Polyplosphaeria fusca]